MVIKLFYGLLTVSLLGACSTPSPTPSRPTDVIGNEVISGNPVRDGFASDLKNFRLSAAPKTTVLARLGGKVTKLTDFSYLKDLPHSELSTLSIPKETIKEWGRLFSRSKETYYVMAEGGNDILLFFDKDGLLLEYVHM